MVIHIGGEKFHGETYNVEKYRWRNIPVAKHTMLKCTMVKNIAGDK
jgi:hypothetical protein